MKRLLFRNIPLKFKLVLLMMMISCTVLVMSTGFYLFNEHLEERSELVEELSSLAGIAGFNSRAALIFDDAEEAARTLAALEARSNIKAAYLTRPDGRVLARFLRTPESGNPRINRIGGFSDLCSETPIEVSGSDAVNCGGTLLLTQPIVLDNERVGHVYLMADLSILKSRLLSFTAASIVIFLVSAFVALLLSASLQRVVSKPIELLTRTMERVSDQEDFTLRLPSERSDELGQLFMGFNAMLVRIEERDRQLEKAKELLEARVTERTADLHRANAELKSEAGERQRVEEELREKEIRLETYNRELSRLGMLKFVHSRDLEAITREIIETIARTMEVERVNIWIYSDDRQIIRCIQTLDPRTRGQELATASFPVYFRAMESEGSIAADDVLSDPRTSELAASYLVPQGITSMLDTSIWLGDRIVGILCCENIGPRRQWKAEERSFAKAMADYVSLAFATAERALAEESLRMLEKGLETTRMGVTIANLHGEIIYTNPAEAQMHGYRVEELLGKPANLLGNSTLRHPFYKQELKTWQRESTNIRKDGSTFPVQLHSDMVTDAEGRPLALVTVCEDITERKAAEQALRASEENYRQMIDLLPQTIFETDAQGRLTFVNQVGLELFGYSAEEMTGSISVLEVVAPEERNLAQSNIDRIFRGEKVGPVERTLLRKNGTAFPALVHAAPISREGKPAGMRGLIVDITERKQAEEALRLSLTEKEVLIREVHHRVKNNLQIISSLLNLQLKKTSSETSREEFKTLHSRVRSMSLIHEKLYQAEGLSQIDFSHYIHEFTRQLFSLYGASPSEVKVELDVDEIHLDVDVAIPCGMIVNELLTNALKHGFPLGQGGKIMIRFKSAADGFLLSIADDGVGLPPGFDPLDSDTLGLLLVKNLVDQIGGTMSIEGENEGTIVAIRSPQSGRKKAASASPPS